MLLALTTAWRGIASAIAVGAAVRLTVGGAAIVKFSVDDPFSRYHARKLIRYTLAFALLIALAIVWRAFAGRVGLVLGLAAAGLGSRCRRWSARSPAGSTS